MQETAGRSLNVLPKAGTCETLKQHPHLPMPQARLLWPKA